MNDEGMRLLRDGVQLIREDLHMGSSERTLMWIRRCDAFFSRPEPARSAQEGETPETDAVLINAPVFQDKNHADCWSIDKDDWARFVDHARSLERRLLEAEANLQIAIARNQEEIDADRAMTRALALGEAQEEVRKRAIALILEELESATQLYPRSNAFKNGEYDSRFGQGADVVATYKNYEERVEYLRGYSHEGKRGFAIELKHKLNRSLDLSKVGGEEDK